MVLFVSSLQAVCYEYGSLCSSSLYWYISIFAIESVVFNVTVFEFLHLVGYVSWENGYMTVY